MDYLEVWFDVKIFCNLRFHGYMSPCRGNKYLKMMQFEENLLSQLPKKVTFYVDM